MANQSRLVVFTLLLINATVLATESSANECDKLLTVPAQFRHAFSVYKDQRFLQPVKKFTVAGRVFGGGNEVHEVELDTVANADEFIDSTKITVEVEFWPDTQLIHVGNFAISAGFSEEYGLKLLFAHYLHRNPGVKRIGLSLFDSLPVSYSIAREALARGVSLKEALASTPIVLALQSLGFSEIADGTEFSDGPGPNDYTPSAFEIWLEVYRP